MFTVSASSVSNCLMAACKQRHLPESVAQLLQAWFGSYAGGWEVVTAGAQAYSGSEREVMSVRLEGDGVR